MEDASARPSNTGCCTIRSTAKFCLAYITTLLLLALIFTASNSEPMNGNQIFWWWAFIISLLLITTLSMTTMAAVVYTDYYKPASQDVEHDGSKRSKSPIMAVPTNSASYKTVLTINSAPPASSQGNQPLLITPPDNFNFDETIKHSEQPKAENFINMTPKSPVTVVDIPARRKTPDSNINAMPNKDDKRNKNKKKKRRS